MKLKASIFAAPAAVAASLFLANCSSDSPSPNTGGAPAGGSSNGGSAGKGGGSAGLSGGGVGAGGASAGSAGTAGLSGGGSGGTSGAAGGGTAVEASFNTVKEMIRLTPCTGTGCHGEEGTPLHWGPDDPKLYELVTTYTTTNCGKLVNVANPADSALLKVLVGECGTAPNITTRMPYGKCYPGDGVDVEACVSPAKVEAIKQWITKGAPQ